MPASRRRIARVSRQGDSLVISLTADVVGALGLKEGDEVEVRVVGERAFGIAQDLSRERALESIRDLRKALPPDWKFDRDEANRR